MSPIEVQIDIDDFQDDELVTLVNKSELSDEQKLLIEKWEKDRENQRVEFYNSFLNKKSAKTADV